MPFDDFREITKKAEAESQQREAYELSGEKSSSLAGLIPRLFNNAAHGDGDGRGRDKRAKVDSDLFFLALMNDGEFGGFVAGEVFGGKSDTEIADIVAEIEAKTGQSFGDYATEILGSEAAQHHPGESDADYHRRLVMALAEEVLDPVTGQIKPQYADDPLAQIILRDAEYQRIMAEVAHINVSNAGPETDARVAVLRDAGYESAELTAHHIKDDGYKSDLRGGQNDHADTTTNSDDITSEGQSFFGPSLGRPSG